jgi:GntR family transcriptional regulator
MLMMIDTSSAVPVYAQIVDQVKRAIATGVLKSGDCLPSLRDTALKLRVNARTVANAYKQLEIEGIIETRHGAGSFVTSGATKPSDSYRHDTLAKAFDSILLDAYQMDFPFDGLKALFEERMSEAGKRFGNEIPETPGAGDDDGGDEDEH